MESAWFDSSTGISGSGILIQELFSWDKFIYIFREMSRPFYLPLHPHAFRGRLRVFYFLHPLVADLCRPTFERFGLGERDGLDDAEDVFCVGAVNFNP